MGPLAPDFMENLTCRQIGKYCRNGKWKKFCGDRRRKDFFNSSSSVARPPMGRPIITPVRSENSGPTVNLGQPEPFPRRQGNK